MKFVLSLLAFASVAASATPESISLICSGRQALIGGTKTGAFVIQASTPGIYTYGNPWKIEVNWQGEGPLVTSGVSCGANLPVDAKCYTKRSASGLPWEVIQECGDYVHRGSVPHSEFISTIVLDGDHGYFNCEGNKGHMHVELSGCQAQ